VIEIECESHGKVREPTHADQVVAWSRRRVAPPVLECAAVKVYYGASRWIVSVARASGEKRWQSRRTPKVLAGAGSAGVSLGGDGEIKEGSLVGQNARPAGTSRQASSW
jgi:hypothetical protein